MSDTSIRVIYHAMSLTVLYDWKRSHLLIAQNSPEKNHLMSDMMSKSKAYLMLQMSPLFRSNLKECRHLLVTEDVTYRFSLCLS